MTKTLAGLMKKDAPRFDTPDPTEVATTDHEHPGVQCRMDTVMQASICSAQFSDDVIPGKKTGGGPGSPAAEKEASGYSCMTASGYNIGLRPRCWFKANL